MLWLSIEQDVEELRAKNASLTSQLNAAAATAAAAAAAAVEAEAARSRNDGAPPLSSRSSRRPLRPSTSAQEEVRKEGRPPSGGALHTATSRTFGCLSPLLQEGEPHPKIENVFRWK